MADVWKALFGIAAIVAAWKLGSAAQTWASTGAYYAVKEFEPDEPKAPTVH